MAIIDRHPTVATVCTVEAPAAEEHESNLCKGFTLGAAFKEVDFSLPGALSTGTRL